MQHSDIINTSVRFSGQCTWGISCRFLHPGVTDKGNYTMFDMVRPMPAQPPAYGMAPFHDAPPFRDARAHIIALQQPPYMPPHVRPPPGVPTTEPNSESAWERGLRTAKEMMRRANKRKEQDVDFDEKKMNLSLAQEEIEKDNYYTRDRASPEEPPPVRTVSCTIFFHVRYPLKFYFITACSSSLWSVQRLLATVWSTTSPTATV